MYHKSLLIILITCLACACKDTGTVIHDLIVWLLIVSYLAKRCCMNDSIPFTLYSSTSTSFVGVSYVGLHFSYIDQADTVGYTELNHLDYYLLYASL